MDIKLKNKNLKAAGFVLSLFLITISLSALFNLKNNLENLNFHSYYESNQFSSDMLSFFSKFENYAIVNMDYTVRTDNEKVSTEEINNLKSRYDYELNNAINNIERKYESDINDAERNGNKERLSRLIEERNKKIQELKEEKGKSLLDVQKELLDGKDLEYKKLKKAFESISDIKYYIKDTRNKKVYTNLTDTENLQQYVKDNAMFYLTFPYNGYKTPYKKSLNAKFSEFSLEGSIIIPQSSHYAYNYSEYNRIKVLSFIQLAVILISLVSAIYILKKLQLTFISDNPFINRVTALYNKIPIDIKMLVLLFALIIAPEIYEDKSIFQGSGLSREFPVILVFVTLFTFYFFISIPEAIRTFSSKEKLESQLNFSLFNRLKKITITALKDKNLLFIGLVYVGAWTLFLLLSMILSGFKDELFILLIFLFFITTLIIVFMNIIRLDKIIRGTDEITKGNLNYLIKEKGTGNINKLAHNINNMKSGIGKAVESQMKSDRLKSELITNVSHDLKTPLTSIINYVDLLKKEDLSKEELQSYISVLERKTQRLKVLIEDLFDASKMASGSVQLDIERIDVAQLLNQALAELSEKIKNSNLIFKVSVPHNKIFAELDGKKTWRVFENLIGNILKYSQPDTRVYIDLIDEADKITITMKNISAYEMEFNVDEIFERFKRGDASRSTEGSGLGLAISKSIVELQGGKLLIEIDGDLFKTIIEFKK